MKFSQLILNITREIFPFKNHAENEAGTLVLDFVLHFNKASYEVKASGLRLCFNMFR